MMHFEKPQQPNQYPHFFVRFLIFIIRISFLCFHSSVYIFGWGGVGWFSFRCICPNILWYLCYTYISINFLD